MPGRGSSGLLTASSSSTWPSGIVVDHHLERAQHGHARAARVWFRSSRTQCSSSATSTVLLNLVTPIALAEVADRLRRVAAAAHAGDRRHARVVPAADVAVLHQLRAACACSSRCRSGSAGRTRSAAGATAAGQLVDEPVVERPVVLELQRADRVRDPLDGVRTGRGRSRTSGRCTTCRRCGGACACRMRYITGSRRFMLGEAMSIFARSTRVAVGELAGAHPLEQVEVLLDGAVAVGAVPAGLGQRAAVARGSRRRSGRRRRPCPCWISWTAHS